MRGWIVVLLLILSSCLGIELEFVEPPMQAPPARPDVAPPTPVPTEAPLDAQRSAILVDAVEPLLLESFPVQIHLQVTGMYPTGCTGSVTVAQAREGATVRVELYQLLSPGVHCPAVLRPYRETIALEGGFEPGTYTIIVNGHAISVTI